MNQWKDKIYEFVIQIPPGKVSTYGRIANQVGLNNPRVVGNILHQNPDPENIPCHRVVNFKGMIAQNYAFGGGKKQKRRLEEEGVKFIEDKIDLKKYLF